MLLAAALIAMFLPWATSADPFLTDVRGVQVSEGVLIMVVSLVTIGLIQVGWRPAWIGAGLVAAIAMPQLSNVAQRANTDVGFGLWIAAAAGTLAAVVLIADLLIAIRVAAPSD